MGRAAIALAQGAFHGAILAGALIFCSPSWAEGGKAPSLQLAELQGRFDKTIADGEHGAAATLAAIGSELEAFQGVDGERDYYHKYWKSYLLYQQAINLMSTEQFEKAKEPLTQAIDLLEGTVPRDVEVVALLSLAAGLHLAYVPRHRIIVANNKVNRYLAEALKLDAENVRALYANAVTDYHVPEEYGGKRKAEGLLQKILAKPRLQPSGLAPRWCGREAATLIVRLYLDESRLADARRVLAAALVEWPDDPRLRRLNEAARER